MTRTAIATWFVFIVAVHAAAQTTSNFPIREFEAGKTYAWGELVAVAENTIWITETPLNFNKRQADAGSIVLHRAGNVLYVIDTGAMAHYRPLILNAAERLKPFRRVILINSHNHIDHTGNNDIIFELGVEKVEHWLAATALYYMSRQAEYWVAGTRAAVANRKQLGDWVPGAGDLSYWREELTVFDPMRFATGIERALETMPLQAIDIGSAREHAWVFGDRDLLVIPTRGHTGGSVVALFPKIGLLALGDESNGHFHGFLTANRHNTLVAHTRYRQWLAGNGFYTLVGGHMLYALQGKESIGAWLDTLEADERREQAAFLTPLRRAGKRGLTLGELAAELRRGPWWEEFYGRAMQVFPWVPVLFMFKRLEEHGVPSRGAGGERRYYLDVCNGC